MAEDTGYGPSDTDPVHQSIATALSYGYSPDEILNSLKSSSEPQHQEWYKNYSEKQKEQNKDVAVVNSNTPKTQLSEGPSTPLLSKLHNLSNQDLALGLGAVGLGGVALTGINQIAKNAVSRIFPSESEIQYREQNNIQKEKLSKGIGAKAASDIEHQQKLRENELAIAEEKLNREKLKTQQLQAKAGIAPTSEPTGVIPTSTGPVALPNAQAPNPATLTSSPQEMANFAIGGASPQKPMTPNGSPAPFAVPPQVNPSSNPTGAIGVGNMPEGGSPAPFATAPTTPAQQALKTELTPPVNNNPTSPIASVQPNPVTSGEGASPLHNPQGQGLTQTEATNVSATPNSAFPAETNAPKESGSLTNKAENPTQGGVEKVEKEIKGAAKPRLDKELILKDTPEQWTKLSKEGQTFLPGYGAGDNNLYNTYGAEGRKAILEKYNNGKPIGSYENYEAFNKKLKAGVPIGDVPDLMSKLPAEEEAGNYGKLGRKGLVKATGVGGLLVTAAQLSHAAEQAKKGNYAPARESLFDLVSALGGVGGMAATHMGGLNKDEEKQLAQHRYAYEMSKKNGAGRGQLNSTK